MNPDAFVVGEELQARAALCTLSKVDNGKILTPTVKSEDLRVRGAKTVARQVLPDVFCL